MMMWLQRLGERVPKVVRRGLAAVFAGGLIALVVMAGVVQGQKPGAETQSQPPGLRGGPPIYAYQHAGCVEALYQLYPSAVVAIEKDASAFLLPSVAPNGIVWRAWRETPAWASAHPIETLLGGRDRNCARERLTPAQRDAWPALQARLVGRGGYYAVADGDRLVVINVRERRVYYFRQKPSS